MTFVVGQSGQKFMVHKSYAVAYSQFLRAAFNGKFVEGQTQTMTLEDVEIETFGLFVHWLYFQKVEMGSFVRIQALARLWVLAGRCLISRLQNEVMSVLVRYLQGPFWFHRSTILYSFAVYAYDSNNNELKMLAIDALGRVDAESDVLQKFWATFRQDILLDTMIVLKERAPKEIKDLTESDYLVKED